MRWARDQGLAIFFAALLLAALAGQAATGHQHYNNEQVAHAKMAGEEPETISLGRYVTSSEFGNAVMENWQSEYLQFFLFILATTWLIQRGSPESKEPGMEGRESDQKQLIGGHAQQNSPLWAKVGGFRTWLFSNSLLLVMGIIFVASWFAQSVTGWTEYNADQIEHEQAAVGWLAYLGTAHFWESSLQNWQSEFLAVGSMVVLSIYLRQRGSPESKPVGAPHGATGIEG
jgi:hypothetical protein